MSSPAESLQNISARINSRFNELFRKAKVSKTFTEDVLSDFNKLRGVFRYWALEKGLSASLEDRMKRHYALRGMENRAYELLQAVRDKFMVILISLNKVSEYLTNEGESEERSEMRLDQSEMRSQIRNIRQYCGDLFLYTEDLERVPYDRRLNSDSGDEWEVPSPSTDFYTITATDSLKDISNRTCTLFDKFILQVPDITMGKSIVTLDEEDIIRSFDGGWNANNEIVESLEEKLKDHFNFKHWCFLLVLEASRFRWWINETLVKKVHSQVILEENQREYLKKIYILLWAAHYAFEDSKDDPYSKNYGSESSSSCDTKLLESHMIAIHENTHRLHRLSVTGYDSES